MIEVEIDDGIGARQLGCAGKGRIVEILALEAVLGAVGRRTQEGFRHRHAHAVHERRTRSVDDMIGAEGFTQCVERQGRIDGGPGVIALDRLQQGGIGTDDRDTLAALQRQGAGIGQQDHGFLRRLQSERAVFGRIDGRGRNGVIGAAVDQTHADARHHQPFQVGVDFALGDQALVDGVGQGLVGRAAVEIGTGLDRDSRGMGAVGRRLMAGDHVVDRIAVRDDKALEPPVLTYQVAQQRAAAHRRAVDGIIGAHQRIGLAVDNGGTEGGCVGVGQVELRHIDVKSVAQGLGARVDDEVFRCRHALEIVWIVALDAVDEGDGHMTGQGRIFAIGFLAAAPARVTEDVDIGRPVVDPVIAVGARRIARQGGIVVGAAFGGDGVADLSHQGCVPCRRHADRLWINRCMTGTGDAVQHFVPPGIAFQAQARNGRGIILHLCGLFLQRHARHQVFCARFGRQVCVQVGGRRGRLGLMRRGLGGRCDGQGKQKDGQGGRARAQQGPGHGGIFLDIIICVSGIIADRDSSRVRPMVGQIVAVHHSCIK